MERINTCEGEEAEHAYLYKAEWLDLQIQSTPIPEAHYKDKQGSEDAVKKFSPTAI